MLSILLPSGILEMSHRCFVLNYLGYVEKKFLKKKRVYFTLGLKRKEGKIL